MTPHLELAALIDQEFAAELERPVETRLDALQISLVNGVHLTVHYAADDAYSLRWTHQGREAGIDTAPRHPELGTFPHHLHDFAGRLRPDPLTDPARPQAENLRRLLRALLADPALESES